MAISIISNTSVQSGVTLTSAAGGTVDANSLNGVATVPNIQITTATTTVSANSTSSVYTAAMTGLRTTSTIVISPSSDISAVTGWDAGSLYFIYWPTANQLNYYIVNPTSASITPGAVTWNVSGK